ncbi:MAG: ATP-binding protein [Litoreibacter sp.]|nr:ATP-binding protein [Litoreibacter sp.]
MTAPTAPQMPRDGEIADDKPNGSSMIDARVQTLSLKATPDAVTQTMRQVRALLVTLHPDNAGVCMNAELVLAEILNNIVEHGYAPGALGEIEIQLSMKDNCILMRTCDGGCAMPGLSLPDPDQPDLDVDLSDLPEGGFGWFMIRALARNLSYERKADRNRICLEIPPG